MADASYPQDLLYHPEHDWVRIDDGDETLAVFGITWYAQDALGEVVFFDPPAVGTTVSAGESYTEVESVKAVSDVIAPLSGEIVEVNEDLGDEPEAINGDPYGAGWMVKVRLSDVSREGRPAGRRRLRGDAGLTPTEGSREPLHRSHRGRPGSRCSPRSASSSVEELFDQIPDGVRLRRELDLPAGMSEQDVYAHLLDLARRNTSAEDELTFLGAGMYDHYVPAAIDMLLGRSEFLTPYTPYQPEISQGGLQVMFEYQTAISELTGLPVSNASVYEGPSAVGAAGLPGEARERQAPDRRLARRAPAQPRDAAHARPRLRHGGRRGPARRRRDRRRPRWARRDRRRHLVRDLPAAELPRRGRGRGGARRGGEELAGAVVVGSYDPIPLGILAAPGECGVDVAVGEGQTLGNRLDFGGPSFGFFAATEAYLRRMPGRIAGETTDVDGRRGFVLTLQTREQHIRREKATSNICTSQALNALAGVVYLAWLGRDGLIELAELLLQRTAYARERAGRGRRRRRCSTSSRSCASSRSTLDVADTVAVRARDRALPGRGRQPGLRARPRLRGAPDRAARRDHRAADAEHIDRLAEVLAEALAAERADAPMREEVHA